MMMTRRMKLRLLLYTSKAEAQGIRWLLKSHTALVRALQRLVNWTDDKLGEIVFTKEWNRRRKGSP